MTGTAPSAQPSGPADVYLVCTGSRMEGLHPKAVFSSLRAAKKYAMAMWEANPILVGQNVWKCEADMVDEVWVQRMKVQEQ